MKRDCNYYDKFLERGNKKHIDEYLIKAIVFKKSLKLDVIFEPWSESWVTFSSMKKCKKKKKCCRKRVMWIAIWLKAWLLNLVIDFVTCEVTWFSSILIYFLLKTTLKMSFRNLNAGPLVIVFCWTLLSCECVWVCAWWNSMKLGKNNRKVLS